MDYRSGSLRNNSYFYDKVVFINYIFAAIILFGHGMPLNYGNQAIWDLFGTISYVAVPGFFMLSAFLFYQNLSETGIISKLKSRVYTLIIPYVAWNFLFTALFFIVLSIPQISSGLNMYGTVDLSVKGFIWSVFNHKFTNLWFVLFLIVFTYLSPIIVIIFRSRILSYTLLVVLIMGGAVYQYDCSWVFWGSFYYIGAVLGYFHKKEVISQISLQTKFKVLFLAFFLVFLLVCYVYRLEYLCRLCYPIFFWITYDLVVTKSMSKDWMKCSFWIYCTHGMLIDAIKKIIVLYAPDLFGGPWIYFVWILYSLVILVSLTFIARVLAPYRAYKWMTGGR